MFKGSVLALDLASTAGYAWGKPNTMPLFGHVRFAKHGESRAQAYRQFRLWLDLWFSAHPKTALVVFESPIGPLLGMGGGSTSLNTIKLLVGLCEHLEEWCHGRVELREASIAAVRVHMLGRNLKSAIAKPLVMAKCRERGWMAETHDESDALALWDYQISCLRPEIGTRSTPLFSER